MNNKRKMKKKRKRRGWRIGKKKKNQASSPAVFLFHTCFVF
jgi:hypothetical protein